jgi:hypothetical protein
VFICGSQAFCWLRAVRPVRIDPVTTHRPSPAAQCVDFFDPGDFLRPLQRVDDAGMATGGDHHQPVIADLEAGCVFMPVAAL